MRNFNSFWPVYKNLEEETLQLSKVIHITDDQLGIYSMYIADLIIRIVIEIESLSKELYKINSGPDVVDKQGKERNLYFDTDCIEYLNKIWKICNRDILVSCSKFDFVDDKYKILKPLEKANKRGTSSAKWNIAYQAVKHDRRNNLKKGNIKNLIQALGALYILNIYYKENILDDEILNISNVPFDNRLGSDIFSASYADASKTSIGCDNSDDAINLKEKLKLDSSLLIIKYSDDTWKNLHIEFNEYNNKIINKIYNDPRFAKKMNEKLVDQNISGLENITKNIIEKIQIEQIKQNPPIKLGQIISNGKKEVILNKGQIIYKEN